MSTSSAANPIPTSDLPTTLPIRVLNLTARFTSSLLGQITAYAGAVTAAVLAWQKFNEHTRDVPSWVRNSIMFTPVILALALHTIPALLADRRVRRLKEIGGDLKPGYFSLAPRDDEASFRRADNKHNDVLQWIARCPGRILYLTGLSGSGKSSLLKAWVLPQLKRKNTRSITLRGYQNPVAVLQKELSKPGIIWDQQSVGDEGILPLLERAARHISPDQLLVAFDQFEECLILQDLEQIRHLEQLLTSLNAHPPANLTFLLVFRSDYAGQIGNLHLPPLNQDDNWKEVPPFTERDAQEFMLGSGLKVNDELLRGVLREAAEIEQTKGLIRPVTINLCGLVLSRFASGVPRGFRPGALIRGFLQESVTLPAIRDVAPRILPLLITPSVTKMPRTIPYLAQISRLDPAVVRGCMLVLGQTDRAIVRPLDAQQETWEISHDFLVPLLDSIIAHRSLSLWRRARPYFPWLAAAILVFTFRVLSSQSPAGPRFGQLSPLHTNDTEGYVKLGESERKPQPFPQSRGSVEPILRLSDIFGSAGPNIWSDIERAGKIVFHATGSTGNTGANRRGPPGTPLVADKMESDFRGQNGKPQPSFLFLLGDVIYSFGERQYYYGQFYLPYVQYPAPILAVAGNHDGLVVPGAATPTLQAFLENFCAVGFHQTPASAGLGRTAQIQPGVYFTFEAPFVRILALYSNTLDGPGVISSEHGKFSELSDVQLRFLDAALNRVKNEKFEGAVIIAVHHDTYRPGEHLSPEMGADLDAVFRKAGVWPHAVLSGHAHNYERYTRTVDGMQIPYIVAGSGGYGATPFMEAPKQTPMNMLLQNDDVRLEAYQVNLGFLRITVDQKQLHIEYQSISSDTAIDSVTVDLKTRQLVAH